MSTRRGAAPQRAPLAALALALVAACSGRAGTHALDGDAVPEAPPWTSALEALLERTFPADEPGGVVLVARGGRPVFRRAFGLADLETGAPLRVDSVLAVGSITKQFTAAAVLALVADGHLALSDDVRTHLSEAPTHGRRVTIEQLLAHTSGMANFVDVEGFEEWARADHALEELLAAIDLPPEFEPGTAFGYSDSGYILLGALIERVSGTSYAEYLEARLLAPLGMESTSADPAARSSPRHARGTTLDGERLVPAPVLSPTVAYAAGGLSSSADDLARWQAALVAGRAVRPDLLERAWRAGTLPDGTPTGYGFGWKACTLDGRRLVQHGGWIDGFTAACVHLVDDDLTAIVLVNRDAGEPEAGNVSRRVLRLVLSGSPEVPAVQLSAAQRAALAGDYRMDSGELRRIRDDGGRLTSRLDDGPPYALVALSPHELAFEESEGALVLRFELGPDARARALRLVLTCEPRDAGVRAD